MPTNTKRQLTERERQHLGRIVAEKRIKLGMSREALAKKASLSWKHLWNIEHGNYAPSLAIYVSLCRALGVGEPPMVG